MDIVKILLYYVIRLVVVAIIISCHEFAHGLVAYWCGDWTAKVRGRLTLNPLAHINPFGFLMLMFVGFGWANPVPIDSRNFKHLRRDYFFVSTAGVFVNIILAVVGYSGLLGFSILFSQRVVNELLEYCVLTFFQYFFILNICFFVFNLLPLYPLDGFRALEAIIGRPTKVTEFLRVYGSRILMVLLVLSLIADYIPAFSYLDFLGMFMNYTTNLLAKSIHYLVSIFI